MKKSILILLFISSLLNAEYLLTITKNDTLKVECITYYDFSDNSLYYTLARNNNTKSISMNSIQSYSIHSGYYLDKSDSNSCKIMTNKLSTIEITNDSLTIHNLTYLGLSNEDLNLMFALSGLFISFLFLFGLFRWI
jgi:hypothetical protein